MLTEYLTFTLSHLSLGIPSAGVLEINNNLDVTPVPGSSKSIKGLLNLRGQIVPAIDMYQYLHIHRDDVNGESVSVILSIDGQLVCLLVDEVGDILPLDENNFESIPNNLSDSAKKLILGGYKLSEKLLLILDCMQIIPQASRVQPLLLSN